MHYCFALLTAASVSAWRSASEVVRYGAKRVKADTFTGMSIHEAKQVLAVHYLNDVE